MINNDSIRLFQSVSHHVSECSFWIIGNETLVFIIHAIYAQVRTFQFLLGDITVSALVYGVRIVVRYTLLLLARIEAEDTFGVLACGEFSESHRFIVVSRRVL